MISLSIKNIIFEQKEVGSKIVKLPTEISYYFETGIRRSIRIVPIFINNELYELELTCVYLSFECKVEKLTIRINEIEDIYYNPKANLYEYVKPLVDGYFNKRTQEQFENDLENAILQFKG